MKEVVFLAAGEADLLAHYDRFDSTQPGTGERFSLKRKIEPQINANRRG